MNRRAVLKKGSLLLGAVAAVSGRSSFAHAAVGGKDKRRSQENLKLVASYLAAWRRKDLKGIAEHLHPNVHFKAPLNDITGKDAVLNSAQRIFPLLIDYGIRSTFASDDQAMAVYDFKCAEPIRTCPTAELLTFQGGQIIDIQLFFDPASVREAGAAEELKRRASGHSRDTVTKVFIGGKRQRIKP